MAYMESSLNLYAQQLRPVPVLLTSLQIWKRKKETLKMIQLQNQLNAVHTMAKILIIKYRCHTMVWYDNDIFKLEKLLKKEFKIKLENHIRAEDAKLIYAADNNSKAIWGVINFKMKHRNNIAHKSLLIAEELNEFLRSVGERLSKQNNTSKSSK